MLTSNRVAIRWTTDATHQGEYCGVAPTGKRVHLEGLDFFHFQGGKISELWIEYDNLAGAATNGRRADDAGTDPLAGARGRRLGPRRRP